MSDELDDTLAALGELIEQHYNAPQEPNEGDNNFRCEGCVSCSGCRFCTGCVRCRDCTYCDGCEHCEGCTQCQACVGCLNTTQSEYCADCEKCSYTVLCLDCEDCVHCFASVGLTGEEFCILNEKFTKSQYFKKVAKLREALAPRIAEGWIPPWIEGDEDEDEAEAEAEDDTVDPRPDPKIPPPPTWEEDEVLVAKLAEPQPLTTLPENKPTASVSRAARPPRPSKKPAAADEPTLRSARRPPRPG